ncbi:MAG: hypothetical protein ABI675_26985 [Chitinophagaceae bacterium]
MNEASINNLIVPANKVGKAVDLEHSVIEASTEIAVNTFTRACKRLLNPPVWQELSGIISASFQLQATGGGDSSRLAQLTDYVRIDIPGPGSSAGNGYDWVQVENIAEDIDPFADQSFGIILATSINPEAPQDGIAHFFKDGATSTFIIQRFGNKVIASYHGRNELPNTRKGTLPDKIRNSVIAAGARAGISELQWMTLIKGLLQKEIGG